MVETSPDSNPQTQDTTQPTPGTTRNSGDSIVALPLLSEQKGPISLTLTIDKSASKVASWIIAYLAVVTLVALVASGIAIHATNRAHSAERRAEDMRDFSNARFEDLSQKYDVLQRDNRIMGDDMRTIRTYLNLKGVPTSHEEVEEKASGAPR
jgi:hypothetical protein